MKKILIANRGEIALRIIKTLRKMGIASVAVYSEADRNSPHVIAADEAILLGPPPSSQSYLRGDKIIAEALRLGVDGIHPGYGFLSENAEFAKAVTDSGINFIGPSPRSMEIMGSKLAAKEAVSHYDIPMIPGTKEAIADPSEALEIAKKIGFPILIKASAGGGGKGMRQVHSEDEFMEQLQMATNEAVSSFGDGAVFIEKYIGSPRHIEFQVFADKKGNTIHLFERECSIQRRHQKVVEEAPSAVLDEKLREEMGEAAINVARSCGYVGAGTVEFLLDENKNFYFLEMNTRLQVEHPVTEMITGLDLVEWQIKIANGDDLPLAQDEVQMKGHAIELRVYAEDPTQNFAPSIGTLHRYESPVGPQIRVDDGFREGMEVPIHYDPMISKLCTYGEDRAEAIQQMKDAISQYHIEGIESTLAFGQFAMRHPDFVTGHFDTHFVAKNYHPNEELPADLQNVLAIAAYHFLEKEEKKVTVVNHEDLEL